LLGYQAYRRTSIKKEERGFAALSGGF